MQDPQLQNKLTEAQQLLDKMAMELRFRGCDDNHKLIRQARELSAWLRDQGNAGQQN